MNFTRVNKYKKSPPIIKLVASEIGFGGGEQIFLDLARALIRLGIQVDISTLEDSKLRAVLSSDDLFKYHHIDAESKIKVWIANDFNSLVRSGLSIRLRRALICHGPWELTWKKKAYMRIFHVELLCVSNYVAGCAQIGIGMRNSRIHVLKYGPNYVKSQSDYSMKIAAKKKFAVSDNEIVIGSLSRYHSVKRINELIEMFRGRQEILLLGLSTGFNTQDEVNTKASIGKITLPPNVKIFENVKNEEFFNAIDVLISLSTSETLGLTFLEASLRGVPSFTTARGGPNDYLVHGLNGYFLKHRSLELNAAEFFCRIQDKMLLERIGRNCQIINENRNPELLAQQICDVLL